MLAAARAAPAEGGRGRGGRSWRLGDGSARLAGAVGRRGRLRGGAGSGRGAEEFPGVVYASPPRSVHAHRSLIGHKLGRGPVWARPHQQRAEPLGQLPPGRVAVRLRVRLRARLRVPPPPRPPPPPPPTPPGAALRTRGALAGGEGEGAGCACAPAAAHGCGGGGRRSVGVLRYRCVRARVGTGGVVCCASLWRRRLLSVPSSGRGAASLSRQVPSPGMRSGACASSGGHSPLRRSSGLRLPVAKALDVISSAGFFR